MSDSRLTVTFGVDVRAQLRAAAQVSGMSESELARQLVQAGLSGNGAAAAATATDEMSQLKLREARARVRKVEAEAQKAAGAQWSREEVLERLGRHAESFRGSLGSIRGEWAALAGFGVSREDADAFLTDLESRLVGDVRRGCDVAAASVEGEK